jgi:GNAT superfamily N-acetyltransferase
VIELTPQQVTVQLHALFDRGEPQSQRCFAVLAGHAVGRVFTDGLTTPTWGMVWEAGDGTLYLGGAVSAPVLGQTVAFLRKAGDVLLGLWHDDPRWALAPADPDYTGATIDFDDRPLGEGLDCFIQQIPADCRVERVDEMLLARARWHAGLIRQFGSVAGFCNNALGFFLMRADEILCEVFAGPAAHGLIELSVETHEPYRRQGYATTTCAHAIQTCELLGYRTHWNCAKQNGPSAALARKLGYRTEREYRLWAWSKQ